MKVCDLSQNHIQLQPPHLYALCLLAVVILIFLY